MNYLSPRQKTADAVRSNWASHAADSINSAQVRIGIGSIGANTANGTVLSQIAEIIPAGMNFVGEYNVSQSYSPYDVVFVNPSNTYAPYSFTSGTPKLAAGLFIATQFVPSYSQSSALFSTLAAAFALTNVTVNSDIAKMFQWTSYNTYYPMYPIYPAASQSVVTVATGCPITVNDVFWYPLSPITTTQIGGNFAGDYNSSSSYTGGATVFVPTTIIYSTGISNVTVIPGYYGLYPGLTASANPVNLNEVPQFPAPTTGSVCWRFLCPALNLVSVCSNGGANVYVASTGTF